MTFSMNVFTTYNVHQKWILGSAMCKAWLSVDYTASNASVMNLPVICVDRYLAITKHFLEIFLFLTVCLTLIPK